MKIKETIERDCCDHRKGDIKPYRGVRLAAAVTLAGVRRSDIEFCAHCGQLWGTVREMSASGSSEDVDVKIFPAE